MSIPLTNGYLGGLGINPTVETDPTPDGYLADSEITADIAAGVVAGIRLVPTLPVAPLLGDMVDLAVDAAGTYGGPYLWRCRWDGAVWHASGPPLFLSNVGAQAHPGGAGVWADLATITSIVVPFDGDYEVNFGANCSFVAACDAHCGTRVYDTVGVGGADPVLNTTPTVSFFSSAASEIAGDTVWRYSLLALNEVRVRYRNGAAGGAANFNGRWISLRPIRLT